jgi:hypothetical protein
MTGEVNNNTHSLKMGTCDVSVQRVVSLSKLDFSINNLDIKTYPIFFSAPQRCTIWATNS